MFVPVACLKCAKPFQVAPDAAGTDVICPWCHESTAALPIANVTAPPAPSPATQVEPFSLDDTPPLPEPGSARAEAVVTRPRTSVPYRQILVISLIALLVTGATVAFLGYGEGRIPASAWTEFTAPDGSFTVELPASPRAGSVDPNPASPPTRGGQRFVTAGWYSGARAWVGWQDLDQAWAKTAQSDRDGVLILAVLQAERDWRKADVGGTVVKEGPVRFGARPGRIVLMETSRGQLVEHEILELEGKPPRLYFLGLESKNAAPGGEPGRAAERIFASFRLLKQ